MGGTSYDSIFGDGYSDRDTDSDNHGAEHAAAQRRRVTQFVANDAQTTSDEQIKRWQRTSSNNTKRHSDEFYKTSDYRYVIDAFEEQYDFSPEKNYRHELREYGDKYAPKYGNRSWQTLFTNYDSRADGGMDFRKGFRKYTETMDLGDFMQNMNSVSNVLKNYQYELDAADTGSKRTRSAKHKQALQNASVGEGYNTWETEIVLDNFEAQYDGSSDYKESLLNYADNISSAEDAGRVRTNVGEYEKYYKGNLAFDIGFRHYSAERDLGEWQQNHVYNNGSQGSIITSLYKLESKIFKEQSSNYNRSSAGQSSINARFGSSLASSRGQSIGTRSFAAMTTGATPSQMGGDTLIGS